MRLLRSLSLMLVLVVLLQGLVGEVVGADGAVGGGAVLLGVASQGIYLVDAEFFLIGEGVFLLPHVGLSVACAADALSGES